jgi:hypothetical protein
MTFCCVRHSKIHQFIVCVCVCVCVLCESSKNFDILWQSKEGSFRSEVKIFTTYEQVKSMQQSQQQSPQGTQTTTVINSNLGKPYTWQNVVLLIVALLINLTTSGTILGWPNIVVVLRQLGTQCFSFVKIPSSLFELLSIRKDHLHLIFHLFIYFFGDSILFGQFPDLTDTLRSTSSRENRSFFQYSS